MGTGRSEIVAAGRNIRIAQELLRRVPGLSAVAVAGMALLFHSWSCERRVERREVEEAEQIKRQASQDISRLQRQAADTLRAAQQSAQAARALDARRQVLEHEAKGLRQKLALLRARQEQSSSLGEQVPGGGGSAPGAAGGIGEQGSEQVSGVGDAVPGGGPAIAARGLALDWESKGNPILLELGSCRQERQVMGQLISNCEQREKLSSAQLEQQTSTIRKLNEVLAEKDRILARSAAAQQAELKAVRGSRRWRWARGAVYFAGGFAAGVLIR
jgi:hypothetical protein